MEAQKPLEQETQETTPQEAPTATIPQPETASTASPETNPIPEEYSMDADAINAVIDRAIEEAKEKGIHGKETTPFLLAKVKEITGGDSLDANIQLVFNNAKLAAQTAVAYCKL